MKPKFVALALGAIIGLSAPAAAMAHPRGYDAYDQGGYTQGGYAPRGYTQGQYSPYNAGPGYDGYSAAPAYRYSGGGVYQHPQSYGWNGGPGYAPQGYGYGYGRNNHARRDERRHREHDRRDHHSVWHH